MSGDISDVFADLLVQQQDSLNRPPPVKQWDPPLCGDMDLVIQRNGTWLHCGKPITRQPMINLFASVLKREVSDYFLVTPAEKWRIQVEDVPLFICSVHHEVRGGQQALIFRSSTGDVVVAGDEHRLWVEEDSDTGEPSPYIHVRAGLNGLLSRSVFYELINLAGEEVVDGFPTLSVESLGIRFQLGRLS